jgi:hypothetical protein
MYHEDITINLVACDYCKHGAYWGTPAESTAAGWKLEDDINTCPVCVAERTRLDSEGETEVMNIGEAIALVTGQKTTVE